MKSIVNLKQGSYPLIILSMCLSFLVGCLSYEEVRVVRVVNTDVKSFSMEGAEVVITLQISNPNNYKITISNFDLDILLNGTKLGKVDVANRIILPKKSNEAHSITMKLKKKDLATTAIPTMLSAAMGGRMQLTAKGTIKAKAKMISKKVPIDFTENISL